VHKKQNSALVMNSFSKMIGFSCFLVLLLIQCKTQDVVTDATKAEASPMSVRVLLTDNYNGKYMESTYKRYKPNAIKPISRSENWYRVIFDMPGVKSQLMAKLRSDAAIIKVETDEDVGVKVQSGKSLKRTKSAPVK
jgi:hypothetical protein